MTNIPTASSAVRAEDFPAFFAAVNGGRVPYEWQSQLATTLITEGRWPDAIAAPTGAGKSSVVDVHLFAVAVTHASEWSGTRLPRRLWHVVGRRALVDSMAERARTLIDTLDDALRRDDSTVVGSVARSLNSMSSTAGTAAELAVVRGGLSPDRGWQDDPLACQIICATPDMMGSGLLFRGYGASASARPRIAGLAAYDSVLVLDEAHLNRQLLVTARRVADLAAESPIASSVPVLQVVESTATPLESGSGRTWAGVRREDILTGAVGDELTRRLSRPKPVHLHRGEGWIPGNVGRKARQAAEAVAKLTLGAIDKGQTPVGVVLNRVASAVELHKALTTARPSLDISLLLGPRRRWEQESAQADGTVPDVYVATQTIEVGVDLDFGCLITDLAPGSSLAQRAGRLNRTGIRISSPLHVLCPPPGGLSPKSALPYTVEDLDSAEQWLEKRALDEAGLAPAAVLGDPPPPSTPSRLVFSEIEEARAALFSRTSEDLVVEPDLTLWLRDDLSPDQDVAVVGRRLPYLGEDFHRGWRNIDTGEAAALLAAAPPAVHEAYPTRLGTLRRLVASIKGVPLPTFVERDGQWTPLDSADLDVQVRPGDVVVVPHDWSAAHEHVLVEGGTHTVGDILDPRRIDAGRSVMAPLHPLSVGESLTAQRRSLVLTTGAPCTGVPDHLRRSMLEVCADLKDYGDELHLQAVRGALEDRGQWEFWGEYLGPWGDPQNPMLSVDIAVGGLAPEAPSQASWAAFTLRTTVDPDDGQLSATSSTSVVFLEGHQRCVAERAVMFGRSLKLPETVVDSLERAGLHHDDGKRDPRFQAWLTQQMEAPAQTQVAKSGLRRLPLSQSMYLPAGWRHEQLSAAYLWADLADEKDELAVRLAGTSHGRGRGFFTMDTQRLLPPTTDERLLAASQDLFDQGGWDALILRTDRVWGLWGVAWLEAVLRAADVTVSKEGR